MNKKLFKEEGRSFDSGTIESPRIQTRGGKSRNLDFTAARSNKTK